VNVFAHTDQPFAPVLASMTEDRRLPPTTFRIACYILLHESSWEISARRVSRRLGIDRRDVTRAFDQLEECGYMKAERIAVDGRLCRSNIALSNKAEFEPRVMAKGG